MLIADQGELQWLDRFLAPAVSMAGPLAILLTAWPDARFGWSTGIGTGLWAASIVLAFGSWWAFNPSLLTYGLILARTSLEDRILQEVLPGYREFASTVRNRLIPGIW